MSIIEEGHLKDVGFEYPHTSHERRHGPSGYADYESYRDWLRDEFTFRCVYCLHREQWDVRAGSFEIDHFIPTSVDRTLASEYSNLVYACRTCNNAKRAVLGFPNPCETPFSECLAIKEDGEIESKNGEGIKLIEVLRLNTELMIKRRKRWIRNIRLARDHDPELFKEFMAFPDDLPDLRRKIVPANGKPEGVETCYFVLREQGKLSQTY